jgi:hypothetical protein
MTCRKSLEVETSARLIVLLIVLFSFVVAFSACAAPTQQQIENQNHAIIYRYCAQIVDVQGMKIRNRPFLNLRCVDHDGRTVRLSFRVMSDGTILDRPDIMLRD